MKCICNNSYNMKLNIFNFKMKLCCHKFGGPCILKILTYFARYLLNYDIKYNSVNSVTRGVCDSYFDMRLHTYACTLVFICAYMQYGYAGKHSHIYYIHECRIYNKCVCVFTPPI